MPKEATAEKPVYEAVQGGATNLWLVTVDEGWRTSIVCSGMYEWAAHWLVEQIQHKPYAPDTRP